MKHVQDKDPAAVQKFENFAAPHTPSVNIDIDKSVNIDITQMHR